MISLEYFLEVAISYLLIAFFQIKNPADAVFGESIQQIKH